MAKNVTVAGASYPDVPSVVLPQTGGGTAGFYDVSDTTATASDVASGKQFFDALGVLTQGTASGGGGGGASNLVTGTFKGTDSEKGTAKEITLNYSGSGYPIAVVVRPSDGYESGSSAYSILKRYGVVFIHGVKRTNGTPTYASGSVEENKFAVMGIYKGSSSNAGNVTYGSVVSSYMLNGGNATANNSYDAVKFKSKTKMSVYIANTTYGFLPNIEYTYHVIYSS